ncbi:MAG: hypothetical protein ABWX66_04880 [Lacisediminihabitans sp.]
MSEPFAPHPDRFDPLEDGDGPDVLEQPASPEPSLESEIDREGVIPFRVPEVGEELTVEQLTDELDAE